MSDDHGSDEPGAGQTSRGLAAMAYSGLVVVGLAAVTLAGVAGTADAAPGLGALKPLTHTAENGTPPHSTRTASAKHSVDIFKVFWDREALNRAYKFVSAQHPKGWESEGYGSSDKVVHGKKVYFERDVAFSLRRLPAGDDYVDMQVAVVPHHGHSWIRVDLQVTWFPRRSAAEHLIASHFRSVTASVYRYNQKPHRVTRTFKQKAIIDRLTKVLNSAEAAPGIEFVGCPEIDTTYTLRFHPVGLQAKVLISPDGCLSIDVKVGRHWQPALVDGGNVEGIILHMLHLRPEHLKAGIHPIPHPVKP
jgi:hypothetical protein